MANNDNNVNKQNTASTYTHNDIGEIEEKLLKFFLKQQYGRLDKEGELANPDLDQRIALAWEKKFGSKFVPLRNKGELPLPLLHGPSGIGKSRVIDGVVVKIAEMLEMNLYINPKGKRSFGPNDLVKADLNFKASGDIPFLLTGMVSVNDEELDDGTTATYTTTSPNDKVYAISENAGAGMRFLFVDEVNSGQVASEAFMALHDNNLGGDINLENTFMVGAGNLGEEDGNLASENPVSMSTRAWNFMVSTSFDTWHKNFVEPAYLSDLTGDFGVSLYLSLNKDKFSETPPKASDIEGVSTVYGMPRTWSRLISTLEAVYQDAEGLAKAGMNAIKSDAQGIVGPAGIGYAEFAHNLWTGVAPLVNEFMSEGGPSVEAIKKFEERQGNSRGVEEKTFTHQWSYQTALTAANLLVENLAAQGLQDGYPVEDKKATQRAEGVFGEVGKRFGFTISGILSGAVKAKTVSGLINEMTRITLAQLPWLEQGGRVRGNLRQAFAMSMRETLKKQGASSEQIKAVSAVFFNDSENTTKMTASKTNAANP